MHMVAMLRRACTAEAGLAALLLRRLRAAGAAVAAYVLASVALHAVWLLEKWADPRALSTPLLVVLFTLQRCREYRPLPKFLDENVVAISGVPLSCGSVSVVLLLVQARGAARRRPAPLRGRGLDERAAAALGPRSATSATSAM